METRSKYQLKHRLLGAILIVGVGVGGIPMLLSEPRALDSVAAVDAIRLGVGDGDGVFRAPINLEKTVEKIVGKVGGKAEKLEKPAAEKSARESAKGKEGKRDVGREVVSEVGRVSRDWTVRVGTFSQAENVQAMLKLLEKNGIEGAKQTPVTIAGGVPATRIWLGPYAERKTADEASQRLKRMLGEGGFVTQE